MFEKSKVLILNPSIVILEESANVVLDAELETF